MANWYEQQPFDLDPFAQGGSAIKRRLNSLVQPQDYFESPQAFETPGIQDSYLRFLGSNIAQPRPVTLPPPAPQDQPAPPTPSDPAPMPQMPSQQPLPNVQPLPQMEPPPSQPQPGVPTVTDWIGGMPVQVATAPLTPDAGKSGAYGVRTSFPIQVANNAPIVQGG
jgi:hypothetical protein